MSAVMAITLHQPYASLVAVGAKRVETRSWAPERGWTGMLLIHAGLSVYDPADQTSGTTKRHEAAYEEMCMREPFLTALAPHFGNPGDLPRGCVIAVARLARCTEMTQESIARLAEVNPAEYAFGAYEPGRFAWVLEDVRRCDPLIQAKGKQKLWHPSSDLIRACGL